MAVTQNVGYSHYPLYALSYKGFLLPDYNELNLSTALLY